ncbi:MAG: magnesium/cobalt transporter CorA [Terrimicrobiaceae bacterium]|jgi:magnesium transporter|nr:magnesium/cobalt transporter CorA [Terrimicrobiaceae bacterium]
MIRINYKSPGTPPATLLPREGARTKADISLIQYDVETIYEANFDSFEELVSKLDPNKVNWINIDGLGDLGLLHKLADQFHIHPLALEDVLNTTQRPKVERFADHFFIVSEMIYFNEGNQLSFEQVSLFLGGHFLITLQEECGHDVFDHVRDRLRAGRGFARKMKADYLAYALLDAAVDRIFPVLESVGDSIESVEEELLDKPTRASLKKLYEAKRLLLHLRRAAWPHRDIFNTLIRDDTGLIGRETQIFLRDCYDHITQIIDIIESYRDLTAGLMDLYLSSLGFRTNEIMRVLTVVTVLFIPLTFLAGVYGMNFDLADKWNMPELKWPFGYLFFWTVCLCSVAGMLVFFKRKKWL